PLHAMLAPLRDAPPAAKVMHGLDAAQAAIEALDEVAIGADRQRYVGIAQLLADLPTPIRQSRLLQVDLFKPVTDARLGGAVLAEIVRGVILLHRCARRSSDALRAFADEFLRRYGDREVPLVEALDAESGIGFERSSPQTG